MENSIENLWLRMKVKLREALEKFSDSIGCSGLNALASRLKKDGYRSYTWQRMKRILADTVAEEIIYLLGPENVRGIFYADLHGGEPVNVGEIGGKDIDIILWLDEKIVVKEKLLERKLEERTSRILEQLLGEDIRKTLNIPNLVELHIVKNLEKDIFGWLIKNCSSGAIPIWLRREDAK